MEKINGYAKRKKKRKLPEITSKRAAVKTEPCENLGPCHWVFSDVVYMLAIFAKYVSNIAAKRVSFA